MDIFTVTLVADGSSDANLLPIVNWVIHEKFPDLSFRSEFAQFLPPAGAGLKARISAAIRLTPCDVVLVHRDAENQSMQKRLDEISAELPPEAEMHIPVVPIRMSESWLLSDEQAIRSAAGNPNGDAELQLPGIDRWESMPDPKAALCSALKRASGLHGRRLHRFNVYRARNRIAEITGTFEPLRNLSGFAAMERRVEDALLPHPLVQASLY